MEKVNEWLINKTAQNPTLDSSVKKDKIKRTIPNDYLVKLAQMFQKYDHGLKGYLNF